MARDIPQGYMLIGSAVANQLRQVQQELTQHLGFEPSPEQTVQWLIANRPITLKTQKVI